MTKIRDYNMNGTIILGVDAGYGNYKTAPCRFIVPVACIYAQNDCPVHVVIPDLCHIKILTFALFY